MSVGKGDGVAELREIFAEFIDGRQMVILPPFAPSVSAAASCFCRSAIVSSHLPIVETCSAMI
ncbi:hypothetical protein M5585_19850 [Serratia ureilytica]